MASSSPSKLHNFELPETWGNDAQSSVTKKPRTYKPPLQEPALSSVIPDSSEPGVNVNESKDSVVSPQAVTSNLTRNEAVIISPEKEEPASKRPKILIKLPIKMKEKEEAKKEEKEITDDDPKLWELRLRRPKIRVSETPPEKSKAATPSKNNGGGSRKGKEKAVEADHKQEEEEICRVGNRKTSHSISIALTKREIEEDLFALTGCKPARRPKKRTKTPQSHLDDVFPGLYLTAITADKYKVSAPAKKV